MLGGLAARSWRNARSATRMCIHSVLDLAERTAALRARLPGSHVPPSLGEFSRQVLHAAIGALTADTEAAAP